MNKEQSTMSAVEYLCKIIDINPHTLSKEELTLLEAELFFHLCEGLSNLFKKRYKSYFKLLKPNIEREQAMIDAHFLRFIISDILSTETYTLIGIAFYAQVSEEIIYELVSGQNTDPSLSLARRIIELHRAVRKELCREI